MAPLRPVYPEYLINNHTKTNFAPHPALLRDHSGGCLDPPLSPPSNIFRINILKHK